MSSSEDAPASTAGPASAGDGDGRLRAFRGCRAVLPPPTGRPGNRPKYCQDGKTWGSAQLTCKAAEAAYLAVESLQGNQPVSPQGLRELGERLDALAEPVAQLLAAVTTTRTQLDEEIIAAYAERDTAHAQAAADRGAREAADQDAGQARAQAERDRQAAAEAAARCAAAEHARAAAEQAALAAERRQLHAEGQLEAVKERTRRAEQLADESAALANQLQTELAERDATLQATTEALAAERERLRALDRSHREELRDRDARLADAQGTHERQLAQLRDQHARAIEELRARHDDVMRELRAQHELELTRQADTAQAAVAAARDEREQALMRLTRAHGEELGSLRQQLRAAEERASRANDVPPPG